MGCNEPLKVLSTVTSNVSIFLKMLKRANYLFENLKLILLKILIRKPSTKYFTYNLKLDQRRQEKWI